MQRDIAAVIPPKANRKMQRSCDWHMYKERHVIECMFCKLKYFRRIATRYEKKASHFMEMLTFAAVLLFCCSVVLLFCCSVVLLWLR